MYSHKFIKANYRNPEQSMILFFFLLNKPQCSLFLFFNIAFRNWFSFENFWYEIIVLNNLISLQRINKESFLVVRFLSLKYLYAKAYSCEYDEPWIRRIHISSYIKHNFKDVYCVFYPTINNNIWCDTRDTFSTFSIETVYLLYSGQT